MKSRYVHINAFFLILLSAVSALLSIPSKGGFAECRTSQFGIMSTDSAFWEIPPLLWPIFSCLCLVLAILSFKHVFSDFNIIVPFTPTLLVLLFVLLKVLGIYDFGEIFLYGCVANG